VPIIINKIEVCLDFYIYDIMDFDLLLGFPLEKLHTTSLGSLDEKLREAAYATTPLFLESSMMKPLPKQNPLEEMMHVSPLTSSEPILVEVVEFSTPQEYDSEDPLHLCEGEQSSSPSIEFEPLPAG
jgi:hypothetical protein